LANQRHAQEHRDENAHHGNCGKPQADDHVTLDADRDLSDQNRRGHHQQREKHQVVEHAVAHRLAERVCRYCPDVPHLPLTSTALACARSASTRFMKNSSSVPLTCETKRIRAPAAFNSSRVAYNSVSCNSTRYRSPVRVAVLSSGRFGTSLGNSNKTSMP